MDRWESGVSPRGVTFRYMELNSTVGPSELPRFRRKYVLGRSRASMTGNWNAFYGEGFGRCTITCYGPAFATISHLSETATIMPVRNISGKTKSNDMKTNSEKPILKSAVKNVPNTKSILSKKVNKNVEIKNSDNEAISFGNHPSNFASKTTSLYEATLLGLPRERYILWRYLCPRTAMKHLKERERTMFEIYPDLKYYAFNSNENDNFDGSFDNTFGKPNRKHSRKVSFSPEVNVVSSDGIRTKLPICDWDKVTTVDILRRKNGVIPKARNL